MFLLRKWWQCDWKVAKAIRVQVDLPNCRNCSGAYNQLPDRAACARCRGWRADRRSARSSWRSSRWSGIGNGRLPNQGRASLLCHGPIVCVAHRGPLSAAQPIAGCRQASPRPWPAPLSQRVETDLVPVHQVLRQLHQQHARRGQPHRSRGPVQLLRVAARRQSEAAHPAACILTGDACVPQHVPGRRRQTRLTTGTRTTPGGPLHVADRASGK